MPRHASPSRRRTPGRVCGHSSAGTTHPIRVRTASSALRHTSASCSIILRGRYLEHTIAAGGVHHARHLFAGDFAVRTSGRHAHRIELDDGPCWTLFLTGPRYRQWGFHCPERGWVHWRRFTAADDPGAIGRGCDA